MHGSPSDAACSSYNDLEILAIHDYVKDTPFQLSFLIQWIRQTNDDDSDLIPDMRDELLSAQRHAATFDLNVKGLPVVGRLLKPCGILTAVAVLLRLKSIAFVAVV